MRTKALTSKLLAKRVVDFAEDKKAQDIVVLDMRPVVNFCDYFVICTGTSERHVKSIAEGIIEGVQGLGMQPSASKRTKGQQADSQGSEGAWVLLDLGDVVIHMFEPQAREFYGLEYLWQDAPQVQLK